MKTTRGRIQAHQGEWSRALGVTLFLAAIFLAVLIQPALAGKPEYLQLNLSTGQALEIEGKWSSSGGFVASDVETLPQARRPKLRGAIQQINTKAKSIKMYGLSISVDDKTEFIESGDKFNFDSLKAGMRVEVSCKIGSDGNWQARKIQARDVKASDKIKGTVSRVAVDGNPPDTIEISSPRSLDNVAESVKIPGIIVILVQETDLIGALLFEEWIGEEEFGDLNNSSATEMTKGMILDDKFFVTGAYRNNFRSVKDFDLSTNFQTDRNETQQDARVEMYGFLEKDVRAFGELRLKKKFLISAQDSNLVAGPYKLELIQLYFLASDIGGKKVALQIGRQDFDEPRQWLFDDYLDAVKLYYYGLNSWLFEAAFIYGGQSYKPQFRDWKDLYASVRRYIDRESYVSAYYMSRSDSYISPSGTKNRQPVWWGVRYYGSVKGVLRPWADLAIMRGEDKLKATDVEPDPLQAWAMDLGVTAKAENTLLLPSVTLGYAVGSGDSTNSDQINHRFRQTGYEDNVDRMGGVTSVSYYGAALDPELSNIKILSLGVGIQPTHKSSVELLYHQYRQHYADNDIKGIDFKINDSTDVVPSGFSTDVGWGLDIVMGFPKLWGHVKSRWVLGWFAPGEAFPPGYREVAFLSKIDIKVGF